MEVAFPLKTILCCRW